MPSIFSSRSTHSGIGVLPWRGIRLVLFSLHLLSLTLRAAAAITLRSQDIMAGLDHAQKEREQKLAGYAAREYYTVRNSHFKQSAELTATVVYRKGQGKTYRILSRSGPGLLQERVINRILKEDAALSRSAERPHHLLTSANYSMQVQGTQALQGTLCYLVAIHPRVPDIFLIEGTAWIDVKTFSLLRIEGKPAASPSFWTGRPMIEREYTVVEGFSFPQHSRATSKGFFTGNSELDVDYSQYVIFRQQTQKQDANKRDVKAALAGARRRQPTSEEREAPAGAAGARSVLSLSKISSLNLNPAVNWSGAG